MKLVSALLLPFPENKDSNNVLALMLPPESLIVFSSFLLNSLTLGVLSSRNAPNTPSVSTTGGTTGASWNPDLGGAGLL